jgi:hypothetical protein
MALKRRYPRVLDPTVAGQVLFPTHESKGSGTQITTGSGWVLNHTLRVPMAQRLYTLAQ